MIKGKRILLAVICTMVLTMATSIPVCAKEDGIRKDNFNYVRYADAYPELKAAYGYNRDKLYNDYVKFGKQAGRVACINPAEPMRADDFDAARYAAEYPDVAAAIGTDKTALYKHFITYGLSQNLEGHSTNDLTDARLVWYRILNQIITNDMTDDEKVRTVHDWMIQNLSYDHAAAADSQDNNVYMYASTIAGTMRDHRGICSGYADTFKRAMDFIGIDCVCIDGDAFGGDHRWNAVKLNGKWQFLDVTGDDAICNGVETTGQDSNYKYYLTSDYTMNGSHVPKYVYTDVDRMESPGLFESNHTPKTYYFCALRLKHGAAVADKYDAHAEQRLKNPQDIYNVLNF
jgi:hypothetical protein